MLTIRRPQFQQKSTKNEINIEMTTMTLIIHVRMLKKEVLSQNSNKVASSQVFITQQKGRSNDYSDEENDPRDRSNRRGIIHQSLLLCLIVSSLQVVRSMWQTMSHRLKEMEL